MIKKNIKIEIDEGRYNEFIYILKNSKKTLDQCIQKMINRSIYEHNLDWLFYNYNNEKINTESLNAASSELPPIIHKTITYEGTNSIPKSNTIFVSNKEKSFYNVKQKGKSDIKNIAFKIFNDRGYYLYDKLVTLASSTLPHFWMNPQKTVINKNWYIILNDRYRKKFHLLYVPANSISSANLVEKSNDDTRWEFQIDYYNSDFNDLCSNISFKKYFVDTVDYSNI